VIKKMARAVAIIGMGQTKHGRRDDVNYLELIYEAVKAALEDAEISPEDVDAVVSGSMPPPMEGVNAPHLYWSDAMAAFGKPSMRVATCGSTGMSIAHMAFYHVASGLFDIVMAVGAEKMFENDPQGTMTTVFEPFSQRPFISGAPAIFTMQAFQYGHRYNLPEERVREAAARISVNHHDNALDNPYAHIRMKITIEDVLKSRIIAYPSRLLDTCPSSDGACAVIFASEEKAKRLSQKAAWVKGLYYAGDEHFFGDSDKVVWESAIIAAKESYKMAGIQNPRKELDVAEVYNPFTFQELIFYECFGFCDRGEACKLVEDGVVLRGGELPCDPSGGVLCSNPIGATGLIRVGEAALQVTGRAGERQILGANTALAHAMGGADQFNGVMIVSSKL
jgi:acetyl-CoA C-acetyltransferase